MAGILEELIEVKKLTELPHLPIDLNHLFPHSGIDGKLGYASISELSSAFGTSTGGMAVNLTDPRFGGKGDFNFTTGVGTDNTAALRAAIAYCSHPEIVMPLGAVGADGKKNYWRYIAPDVVNYIYVPYGSYKITETILLPPYIRIVGCSAANFITNQKQGCCFVASGITGHVFASASVKFSDGTIDPNLFVTAADIDNGVITYVPSPEFERICIIKDPTKPQVPLSMIKLSGATEAQIHNCTFIGSKFSVIVNTSWNWDIGNNMCVPTIAGIVLTESITTGNLHGNEVNGALMPVSGTHTDNTLPYGFASGAGQIHSGKCVGIYQAHSNVEFKNNVVEFGMYYGVVSESSGGTIDNTYCEGLAAGGSVYAQKLSAYMKYIVGETSIAANASLFNFADFARSEVHFTSNVCTFSNFGNVHPSCDIKLYQFRNLGVTLPKGVTMVDNFASDINDALQNVLSLNYNKVFNLIADCPLSANVNLFGDRFVMGNGKTTTTKITATSHIYAFTRDIVIRDLSIDVNVAGLITPVIGKYVIHFKNCVINLLNGSPLFTNDQAFVNEENDIEVIFEGCTVTAATPTPLIGNMLTQWSRLNFKIKKYQTTFTNITIPTDSISLKITEVTGYPSTLARADGSSYGGGRMLNADPLFRLGMNGITAYNNSPNTNVTVTRVVSSQAPLPPPTDSGYVLKVANTGIASPDTGGFKFATPTRSSAVFRTRFIALVPVGMTISLNTNLYGVGGYTTENKPRVGTGRWEEYIFTVYCGVGGTFDTTNLFSFIGPSNQTIWLASATVYDMTLEPVVNDGGISTPIEVELVPAFISDGAISVNSGALDSSNTGSKYSGFLAVTPGEELVVTLKTTDFNTSPPIFGTGLAGYSASSYASFMSTLSNSYPIGDILSVERYNQTHGTALTGPLTILSEVVKVPPGVYFVNGSSDKSVVLSIKAIRQSGLLSDSIKQLYSKVNHIDGGSGGGNAVGGVVTDNNFTDVYKNKIDSLPQSFIDYRDGVFYLPDLGTGKTAKVYVSNQQWVFAQLATTFGAFNYPLGFAYDYDKRTDATYQAVVDKSRILTCENATNVGHIRGGGETSWNWTEAQNIVNYCRTNGMKMHWAHLLWLADVPTWLASKVAANPTTSKAILTDFIVTTFTTVLTWIKNNAADIVVSANVTNEWIYNGDGPNDSTKGGKLKDGIWNDNFTDEELFELCYTTANQAYTGLVYYSNETDLETSNEKQSDTYKRLIDNLKLKNITVNGKLVQCEGMGFQMHTYANVDPVPDLDILKRRISYWTAAPRSLKFMVTEMDAFTSGVASTYTPAVAKALTDKYVGVILAYERTTPLAQRGGIVFWTSTDKFYINSQGKNAPDNPTNPIVQFPAMFDYYGQPKAVWSAVLALPDRASLKYDVFQDFIATGVVSEIAGTSTKGLAPLVWQKVGTSANAVGVNSTGLGGAQSSSNTYNFALVDLPYPNRKVGGVLRALAPAGTRSIFLVVRYQDTSNYIAVQGTDTNIWQLVKRVGGTDTVLFATTIAPKAYDEPVVVCTGNQLDFYINGVLQATITDASFSTTTLCGVKVKGYNDKFTRWSEFYATHV